MLHKSKYKSLKSLRKVLIEFSDFTSLMVNQQKSGMYLSKKCRGDQSLLQILDFPQKSLPLLHLCVPLVGKELQDKGCEGLLNQLNSYGGKWKNKMFSYKGRIQLVNWVPYSTQNFWFQVIQMPS